MTSATPQAAPPVPSPQPTRLGIRWSIGVAALAICAMVAGVLAPGGSVDTDEAGIVRPMSNMVEMLDDDDVGGVVTLAELRQDVLGSYSGNGAGIDVALIDTGVAPVDGLDGANVIHGPDLSAEGASPEVAYLDTYGHGTHMAGIIAGNRSGAQGIAPGARVVSIKTAGHDGVTTVPQVVAAIDWVVEHRNQDGLNIRVLNLSLGLNGVTTHIGDELSAAVERAWHAGIVVVVAAGNDGDTQPHLDSPAIDPYVIAIGASDPNGGDDDLDERAIPGWSGQGNGQRNPDVVAPGRSIASYRVPGSAIDVAAPSAVYQTTFFKGSGTSQAAAVTSGLAALLLADNPGLTPDQVKDTIRARAVASDDYGSNKAGQGHVFESTLTQSPQIDGEGQKYPGAAGRNNGILFPTGATWTGGQWAGGQWAGGQWAGATWTGATWTGGQWAGGQWAGATWTGATWTGATWTGGQWAGATWTGATWTGATWTGATWTGNGWS